MTTWCDTTTAVQVVKSGDRLFVPGRCTTPTPLIEALVARGEELRDVEIIDFMSFGPSPYLDPRWVGHFHLRTVFVGASSRAAINAGRASYVPVFLSYIPKLFMPGGPFHLDVALIQVSPPDKHGYCSLGPNVDATHARSLPLSIRGCRGPTAIASCMSPGWILLCSGMAPSMKRGKNHSPKRSGRSAG